MGKGAADYHRIGAYTPHHRRVCLAFACLPLESVAHIFPLAGVS